MIDELITSLIFCFFLTTCSYDIYILSLKIFKLSIIFFNYLLFAYLILKLITVQNWNHFLVLTELKNNGNDSLFHFLSYFWTYPQHLTLFFFALILFVYIFFIKIKHLWCFIVFFYFNEALHPTCVTTNLIIFYQNNFNFFLTNFLNKYHPCLFYLNCIFFFLIIHQNLRLNFFKNSYLFFRPTVFIDNKFWKKLHFLTISLTLFLGSWWAFQESSWGGWWNWDFSEVFGALFFIISLNLIHQIINIRSIFCINIFLIVQLLLANLSYYFLQLNFKISSHNFGEKFFFFYNNNFFFLELILFAAVALIFFNRNAYKTFEDFSLFKIPCRNYLTNFFFSATLLTLIVLLIFFSVSPILSNFWWMFFNQKLQVSGWNFNLIIIELALFTVFLYFWNLYWIFIIYSHPAVFITNFVDIKKNFVAAIHILVIFFLVNNVFYFSTNFFFVTCSSLYWEFYRFYKTDWFFVNLLQLDIKGLLVERANSYAYFTNLSFHYNQQTVLTTITAGETFFISQIFAVYTWEIFQLVSLMNLMCLIWVFYNRQAKKPLII